MMMKRAFIMLLWFLESIMTSRADQGCTISDPALLSTVYTTEIGSVSPKRYYLWGSYVVHSAIDVPGYCQNYYHTLIPAGALGSCKINYLAEPNSTTTIYTYDGYLVDFAVYCPLDDHFWVLGIGLCGLGFYVIRRRVAWN